MAYTRSTTPHLTLRRIERQHALIEELRRRRGAPRSARDLAAALQVTPRTVERDIALMRASGIPIRVRRGPGGGYLFDIRSTLEPITFEPGEIAALLVALVALGATETEAARSSMHKLTTALSSQERDRMTRPAHRPSRSAPAQSPQVPPTDDAG
ncbi:HTH domain-containing protein [Promicromonospora umidemergens]|uniref:Helix-turn-helix type 11 domain-containing protein n=1 Tax=Promicromonospora umidemergens TaxID=629679 RepID=A0ABP8X0D0_9MICO|nr:HTH domain-containing protein [Promicromonospora umidemergens]MCP2285568.1 HTH domain-containing protein [Promicromonospora umidemergens]